MSQISITLLSLATVLPYVLGHSGPAPLNWQRDNVNARDALQNKCSGTLDEARRKRSLAAEQSANLKRRELNLPERRSFSIGEGQGSRRSVRLFLPSYTYLTYFPERIMTAPCCSRPRRSPLKLPKVRIPTPAHVTFLVTYIAQALIMFWMRSSVRT